MDSFYEQPRIAPVPTSTEKIPVLPVVPEVSMIFQNSTNENCSTTDSIYLSYNAWKARNQSENGKPSHCLNPLQINSTRNNVSSSMLTKQVRFESPITLQQQQKLPSYVDTSKSTSASLSSNHNISYQIPTKMKTNVINAAPGKSGRFTKPFEQIYMANIPNRHLDLSIIDPPRTTVECRENLENIIPNVNVGSNRLYQHEKRTVDHPTNHLRNLKDVPNQHLRVDQYSLISNRNKFNDYQYPEKLGTFKAPNMQHREDVICGINKSDPLEKNRVIDLYNYKGYSLDAPNSAYGHRQTLDNLDFPRNHVFTESPAETHLKYSHSNNCMYDSFDSHTCGNNKHHCNCSTSKQFHTSARNNAAMQTETVSVPANPNENLHVDVVNKGSDEPTVKDLLKIIHQQNDQLLILQKQVAALLNNRDTPKQIEAPPSTNPNINLFSEKYRTSTQLETQPGLCNPLPKCLPRKGPLPQFSVDVMTSFEVSIRRPPNLSRAYKDVMNYQPKITEVTESDSNTFDQNQKTKVQNVGNVLDGLSDKARAGDNTEVSLTLNEPVHVRETCPTPENTVRIDMEDYSSDSDDEVSAEERWFYKNVKGQVNHILRKSGIWPDNELSSNVSENSDDVVTQNIRKKVKEATIKHLKSIGVHVPTLEDIDDVAESNSPNIMGCNSNKVSFAVKQLLMKYLPNEQLAKLAFMETQNNAPQEYQQTGLIKRRPEFSFATVQYMQKYNLLTDVASGRKTNPPPQTLPTVRQEDNFDRILDVSAIRQQPKLL